MPIPVPTLSSSGWVVQISEKADKLLSYFFTSEASQSEVFVGSISSLPDIIKKCGHDDLELRSTMERTMRIYLERYFSAVDIVVTVESPEDGSADNRTNVIVHVKVYEEGNAYEVGHLIEVVDSAIQRIILQNNG